MITVKNAGILKNGVFTECAEGAAEGRCKTMAYSILESHNLSGDMDKLSLRFDCLASHDITYVGIIQTARASGLEKFPMPYILTNCHNSLCAVGGTINEDDHMFGLSAAKKYGGIFVPAHQAVIHQYMREMYAGGGRMILASDSHTRYGALGTLAIGEGGPELTKQLLGKTYDLDYPEVICVELTGRPNPGVGPQDVALALIREVFDNGFVKNKILEFVGDGITNLSMDYRNGIDVMTTESACLSSIWMTDEKTREFLKKHGREDAYKELAPADGAYYDGYIKIELDKVPSMIAMPFHPSNAYPISEFLQNAEDIIASVEKDAKKYAGRDYKPVLLQKYRNGEFFTDQGIIAGCSGGTFENLCWADRIIGESSLGDGAFALSLYPASQSVMTALIRGGQAVRLLEAGAVLRTAFCGPCFGAGDVPSNNGFSVRHSTRNFPSREGAKPGEGQMGFVALMDARSIAATAVNGGRLTAADSLGIDYTPPEYEFDPNPYEKRVYNGWGNAMPEEELILGPNITDWPKMPPLPVNALYKVCSAIYDPVTTTDELIPSGETSSLRSNPVRLSEFALSRKDPDYVPRAKAVAEIEKQRQAWLDGAAMGEELKAAADAAGIGEDELRGTGISSLVFALRPGDGSAREQAASCQRVLGGGANIAAEYATKRYRSNVVNWGMLPFILKDAKDYGIAPGDIVYVPGLREAVKNGIEDLPAVLVSGGKKRDIVLSLPNMSRGEADIILAGCLINYYAE